MVRWKQIVSLILLSSTASFAQIPRFIAYQGVLTDLAGNPIKDSSYIVTIQLDTLSSGGSNPIWKQIDTIKTKGGAFTTFLGKTPLSLPFDRQYWLSLIKGTSKFTSLPLYASPYALRADTAQVAKSVLGLSSQLSSKADKMHVDSLVNADTVYAYTPGSPRNSIYVASNGNVGIGTTPTRSKLEVAGDIECTKHSTGIILRDTTGVRWRIFVSDSGTVLSKKLP